jgi:hypothetical protein
MEKAGQGFWYRCIANSALNPLRAWAQSGALRGAICASLLYDGEAMPDKPLPSQLGGIDSDAYKEAYAEYEAQCKSAWPFKLDYIDPQYVLPDIETEGRTYIITCFTRKAADVKRAWPNWDYRIPDRDTELKPTDDVQFISYWDKKYRAYIVGGSGSISEGRALNQAYDGVQPHGYGFLPYFFMAGGYGSPFGKPEDRYAGLLTRAKDLFRLEARRTTHMDALIGQQAFPNIVAAPGAQVNRVLGGVTIAPPGVKPSEAIYESRPVIPVQEIVIELQSIRAAIQRATLPDSLASEPSKSDESGYLRSLKIGTGRSRIRSLTDGLERICENVTTGFYKLVENKVKAPVSVWGKGLDRKDEFVTIRPSDINGHYEVYVSLAPSLPQDESSDIANGLKLFEHGLIPGRDVLETYARRENPEELLTERLGEDVLKSPPMMQQLVMDAMAVTQVTGGPIAAPGFASGMIGVGAPAQPVGMTADAAASNAGVGAARSIPTPPAAPGSLRQSNQIIGKSQQAGPPQR